MDDIYMSQYTIILHLNILSIRSYTDEAVRERFLTLKSFYKNFKRHAVEINVI